MRKPITAAAVFVFILSILFIPSFAAVEPDATYLEKEIRFTLHPDGSWEKEYHHRLKLETYLATNRLAGYTSIEYNPQYQELKVLKSETTTADGKKVPSPANAFNEVLPRSAQYFPHYAHLRRMVVAHTGLERGAVVALHYRLKTKPAFMPYFSAKEFIADRVPVDHFVLKISIPPGKKFHYKCFHVDVTPVIKKESERVVYTFTLKGIKSYTGEPLSEGIARSFIVFSTAGGWESVFPSAAEAGPLPPELAKKIDDMKPQNPAALNDEFYFKLQTLVTGDIENCRVGMDLNGFAVRKLQEVYASNYATAVEKVFLLYHILKHLNLPAEIAAVPAGNQLAANVPTLFQLDHYLIKIKKDPKHAVFLNPWKNGQHLFPYEAIGTAVYNLQEKDFQVIEAANAPQNRVDISGKIKIDKEKTSGELNVSVSGYFYPYRSTLGNSEKALLKVVRNMLPISKLEVKKIALLTPQQITAHVSVEGNILKEIYQQRLLLEKLTFPHVTDMMISLKERDYPLNLEVPFDFRVNLELRMPEDMEVTFLVPPVNVRNDVGYYEQEVKSFKPGVVTLKMALGTQKAFIDPQTYSRFKEIMNKYFIKEPLVIFKAK